MDTEDKHLPWFSKTNQDDYSRTCQRGTLVRLRTGNPASIIQERGSRSDQGQGPKPHPEMSLQTCVTTSSPPKPPEIWKAGRDRTRGLGPVSAFTHDSKYEKAEDGCLDKSA